MPIAFWESPERLGCFALYTPEAPSGRIEELFPGVRADHMAKEDTITPPVQPIPTALLLIRPSGRKIIDGRYRLVDDPSVGHCGA